MPRTSNAVSLRTLTWTQACACVLGLLFCAGATIGGDPSDLPAKSILRWTSGDQLAGEVIEAGPQTLTWNSNLFEEPLQLRLSALRSITWQYDQPSKLSRNRFRVETVRGNLLVGDLVGVDQGVVRLENSSLGIVEIPRKNVRSVVNLTGSAGRWLGPMSLDDWDAERQSKQSLTETAQGQIVLPQENLVFRKFAVKEKTLIDVSFRWAGTLDMKFGFAVPRKWGDLEAPDSSQQEAGKEVAARNESASVGSATGEDALKQNATREEATGEAATSEAPGTRQGSSMVVMKMDPGVLEQLPRLEMFSDAMVLQQKEDFDIVLEEVDMASGFLRLVFEWNPQANEMKAFDASGKLLATIALDPLSDDFEPGLFVLNQNGRLTLDNVVVTAVPEGASPLQAVAVTKQGTLAGTVEGFDGRMWSIRLASDQSLVQVSKDDLYMSHVACVPEEPAASGEASGNHQSLTKIELRDGSRVTGELQSIADNALQLLSDLGSKAATIRLDRAQRLEFPKVTAEQTAAGQADPGTHLLETAEGQCHGSLSQDATDSTTLLWKAVGSDVPVSLLNSGFRICSTDAEAVKARELIEWTPPKNPQGYRDQLYLRNGDRFPANIDRVQSGQLHAEVFQQKTIFPSGEVLRCLLGAPNGSQSTIDAPPWQVIQAEERKPNLQAMEAAGIAFDRYACHPLLLDTGGFAVTVRGGMNKTKVEVGMAINSHELTSRLEFKLFASKPSDPCTQAYLSVSAMPDNMVAVNLGADPMLGDGLIPVSLPATDDIVCRFRIVESEVIGSINGKEAYRKKLKLSPDSTHGVVIGLHDRLPIVSIQQDDSYSVRNAFVRQDSREVALTEPRFVSHQPARSLLVGRNGDLWRADIVSMDDESVMVRSGGRHLEIERSLVSSLVWPDPAPVEEKPVEAEPSSEAEQGNDEQGNAEQGNAEQGNAGQPVEEGVKGEAVPPEVALVPEKAGKVTDVQFVMSDGTKLTLTLESWGKQTVVGSSPYYGRMELPIAEIIELRSGSQITSATDYEGQLWRFKLGRNLPPEQAPPEGGEGQGEGQEGAEAAMVGQEAPTFTIKSLDGSDIDLAAYRGKVVVLDFWATWCGYCVEELPGMVAEIGKLPQDRVQLITLDQNEEPEAITAWMNEKGLKFLVGLDKDQVAPQYKVNGLPTTFVIDPSGKIVHVKIGGGEEPFERMMEVVRNLVADGSNALQPSSPSSGTSEPSRGSSAASTAGNPGPDSGGPVTAEPDAADSTGPESRNNGLVKIAAHIQPARADQPALLVIQATIARGHKVFSLTQQARGPVKTGIHVNAPAHVSLREFVSLQEPEKYPDPIFNNMEVEVHEGSVTWYSPLEIASGASVEALELEGNVNMQVCSRTSCYAPRDYPFTARLDANPVGGEMIELPGKPPGEQQTAAVARPASGRDRPPLPEPPVLPGSPRNTLHVKYFSGTVTAGFSRPGRDSGVGNRGSVLQRARPISGSPSRWTPP